MKSIFSCAVILMLLFSITDSWSQDLFIPLNIQSAFNKDTRSADGQPGKKYWQNRADYNLKINFNPKKMLVEGVATITYHNYSPDTLKKLVFKLAMNLYKKDANRLVDVEAEDENDGIKIQKMMLGTSKADTSKYKIEGTVMSAKIQPLAPGRNMKITIQYSYPLNKKSHYRTGMIEKGAFFIAYFFPRIAVYDDIDGWDNIPYLGNCEFYNDFCDFNVDITVPNNYIVWATGDLMNTRARFQKPIVTRILNAEHNDGIVDVITEKDLKSKTVLIKTNKSNWKFKATNVTDFVFALSDHYIWKSSSIAVDSSGRRTRVDAVYSPKHKDFNEVINFSRATVDAMSYKFPKWPFPYQHITVVDGLDQMEYPMMVNDNPLSDRAETIELTDHEIIHTMFPFYMGTNEVKYGWMDEGWATIGEWLITPMIDPKIVDDYGMDRYEAIMGRETDVPITTPTNQMTGATLFNNNYPKPALAYLYVKDLLGDSLFFNALHHYIRTWNGKHPMPYDFFNCMNAGSGQNLNWFWKRWFFETGYADLTVKNVAKSDSSYIIEVQNLGTKPVPVDITVVYDDDGKKKFHRDISCWQNGETSVYFEFETTRNIKQVTLGDTYTPDINKQNNLYEVK